jgi:hypothetical protein
MVQTASPQFLRSLCECGKNLPLFSGGRKLSADQQRSVKRLVRSSGNVRTLRRTAVDETRGGFIPFLAALAAPAISAIMEAVKTPNR